MVDLLGGAVVVSAFAAGAGTLGLMWYLRQYREAVSATWFIATLGVQALIAFAYGLGLLVFDPALRAHAEAVVWVGLAWLGPLFLGFALSYTGRRDLFRSRRFRTLFAVPTVGSLLALTHPLHGLLWQEFRITPLFGLATVRYEIQPLGFAVAAIALAAAAVAVLLLVETIVAYGPLYRREAIAVAVSTLPPAAAFVVWLAGVGPWPELNLGVAMLVPHVLFDAYAFVGTHMFETNPTTQRAAARSALDDLDNPLFVVDADGRVVKRNDRAESLFDAEMAPRQPIALDRLVGVDLATLLEAGEIEVDREGGRVFSVSYTPLTDSADTEVGGLVVLYDISTERRQNQQLDVLNRILRHNLRNELTVILGRAQLIESAATDSDLGSQAGTIRKAGERLRSISEKARDFSRVADREPRWVETDLASLVASVVHEAREAHPEAEVDVEVDVGAEESPSSVRVDPDLLSLALSNLVDNAIVHAVDEPTVRIRVSDQAGSGNEREIESGPEGGTDPERGGIRIAVSDDNPEIDASELAPIRSGDETDLQHGSGIGLWIVKWCVTALQGELRFEYDGGNVVVIELPPVESADGSR
ncbi:histidine kinase N-terminal 7TM domain-containing protein [Halobellus rubicundus]|uniref:histidine kinase n=1 Tax=Halobellus rubicundus TaxID=2996466 RepID=A0ABD5MDL9_9EURY